MLTLLSFQFIAGGTAAFLAAIALALWKRLSLSGMVAAVCALAIVVPSFLLSAGTLHMLKLLAHSSSESIPDVEAVLRGLLNVMNLMQLGLIGTLLLFLLVLFQVFRRRAKMDAARAPNGELPLSVLTALITLGFLGGLLFEFGNRGIQKIIWAFVAEDIQEHPLRLAALHAQLADRTPEAFANEIALHIMGFLGGSLLVCGGLLAVAAGAASLGRSSTAKGAMAESLLARAWRSQRTAARVSLALVAVLGLGAGCELIRLQQQKSWVHLGHDQRYAPVERIWSFQTFPLLPEKAREAGAFGPVSVEITVELDGTINQVRIVKGHHLLNQAAIDAVLKWRFSEELLAGLTEPQKLTLDVDFEAE